MANSERSRRKQLRQQAFVEERSWWQKTQYQIAAGLGTAAIIGGGVFAYTQRDEIVQNIPGTAVVFGSPTPETVQLEFSGDVEETRALIKQWNTEVGSDQRKLERYFPRISQLAAAYFSRQMTEMFPEKAAQYNKQHLAAVFKIVDEQSFAKKAVECNGTPFDSLTPAFNGEDGNIYITSQRLWKGMKNKTNIAETAMLMDVHELMHHSAPRIVHAPTMVEGSDRPITSRKGLVLYAEQKEGVLCSATVSYWGDQEEIIAEDGITELMQRIGVANTESRYIPGIYNYRNRILTIPGLSREQLLERQQSSDVMGLILIIGSAAIGEDKTRIQKINVGGNIIKTVTR